MQKKIEYSSYYTDGAVRGYVLADVRRNGSKTFYVISRRAYNRACGRVIGGTAPRFHLSGKNEYVVYDTKYGFVCC